MMMRASRPAADPESFTAGSSPMRAVPSRVTMRKGTARLRKFPSHFPVRTADRGTGLASIRRSVPLSRSRLNWSKPKRRATSDMTTRTTYRKSGAGKKEKMMFPDDCPDRTAMPVTPGWKDLVMGTSRPLAKIDRGFGASRAAASPVLGRLSS